MGARWLSLNTLHFYGEGSYVEVSFDIWSLFKQSSFKCFIFDSCRVVCYRNTCSVNEKQAQPESLWMYVFSVMWVFFSWRYSLSHSFGRVSHRGRLWPNSNSPPTPYPYTLPLRLRVRTEGPPHLARSHRSTFPTIVHQNSDIFAFTPKSPLN